MVSVSSMVAHVSFPNLAVYSESLCQPAPPIPCRRCWAPGLSLCAKEAESLRGPQGCLPSTGCTKGTMTILTKVMAAELGPYKVGMGGGPWGTGVGVTEGGVQAGLGAGNGNGQQRAWERPEDYPRLWAVGSVMDRTQKASSAGVWGGAQRLWGRGSYAC